MNYRPASLIFFAGLISISAHTSSAYATDVADARVPLIVELFTSQSCSSCPPAEHLAARLVREQPVAGAEIIVLAEHVSYWDHLNWKDPYSSEAWTQRQSAYSQRISGRPGNYTPQMVVGGVTGVVGSDEGAVLLALREIASQPRGSLKVTVERHENTVMARVEHSSLSLTAGYHYWAALLQDDISTHVRGGENSGSTLKEEGVLRSLQKLGTRTAEIALPTGDENAAFRVVVFSQNAKGHIASAGQVTLPTH